MNHPLLKEVLTRIGRFVSPQWIHNANGLLNYLYVGWWMKQRGYHLSQRWRRREELYTSVAQPITERPVSYLEFGVYRGDSIRRWSEILRHPETRLDGFDSFQGLPESWVLACNKGYFDLNGELPAIPDSRVALHKGWFSDTLPEFLRIFRPQPQLVVHLDADLYSSTIFVLTELRPWLVPGTVLLFDEIFDRNHELKALDEFITDTGTKLECLGVTVALQQAAFRVA